MISASPPIIFPIEVRFTVTEEIASESESVVNDAVMPAWLRMLFPFVIGLQLLVQLPKIVSGNLFILLDVLLVIGALYGLMFWIGRKQKKKGRALLGHEIVVRFHAEALDLSIAEKEHHVDYGSILRVGRDERGLVIFLARIGALWLPMSCFASAEQRDSIFLLLGEALKKK